MGKEVRVADDNLDIAGIEHDHYRMASFSVYNGNVSLTAGDGLLAIWAPRTAYLRPDDAEKLANWVLEQVRWFRGAGSAQSFNTVLGGDMDGGER